MAKTYAVGGINSAVRRDNHTGSWITLVPIGDTDTTWNDVMSDPIDETKVIIVGANTTNNGALERGIQVSSDSGVTWGIPGGTWDSGNQTVWYELWYVDTSTIWVTGSEGRVAISNDGGATFDLAVSQISAGSLWNTSAIFAIDDQIAVVLGNQWPGITATSLFAWKTIDGGANWTTLNGGLSLPAPTLGSVNDIGSSIAIWMSPDEQTIIANSSYNHYISIDGGTTWDDNLTDNYRSGVHMTWFPAYNATPQHFRVVGGGAIQISESLNIGISWSTTRGTSLGDPFLQLLGAHFYSPQNGYYSYIDQGVSYIDFTSNGGVDGVVSHSNIDPASSYLAIWTSIEMLPLDPCFLLEDCEGILDPIYTNTDLSAYVGTVITIQDSTGHQAPGCWIVTDPQINCPDTPVIEIYKCFTDCDDCLPIPDAPDVPMPRIVDPGVDVGQCDVNIVIDAMCAFSEMKYEQTMSMRYGIKYCCPPNEMGVIINYEKITMKLATGIDPTPELCDPECWRYEFTTEIGDTTVITYNDCDDVGQIINVLADDSLDQLSFFCAINTTAPTAVVTHPDTSIDTYTLEAVGIDCIPPAPDNRACISYEVRMSNIQDTDVSFSYEDCDGNTQVITKVGGFKDIAIYTFCAIDQIINPPAGLDPSDTWIVTNLGDCVGGVTCRTYDIIVNTSIATTIQYIGCDEALESIVIPATKADLNFTICGIGGQVLTTTGNVHNYLSVVEIGDC